MFSANQVILSVFAPLYKKNLNMFGSNKVIANKPYFPFTNSIGSSLLNERRVHIKAQETRRGTSHRSAESFRSNPSECQTMILHPHVRNQRPFHLASANSYKFRPVECRALIRTR